MGTLDDYNYKQTTGVSTTGNATSSTAKYDPNRPSSDYVYTATTDAGKAQAAKTGATISPYGAQNAGDHTASEYASMDPYAAAAAWAEAQRAPKKTQAEIDAEAAAARAAAEAAAKAAAEKAAAEAAAKAAAEKKAYEESSHYGASEQMKAYDQYAQQALGKSPAEAMRMAKEASAKEQADLASADAYNTASMGGNAAEMMKLAQAASAQTAQAQSDQAVQQAAKAARTSGAMGGAAALAATGQAANAYGTAQGQGQQAYYQGAQMGQTRSQDMAQRAQNAQNQYFNTAQLGAQLGSEMSGRLQNKEADATQRYGIDRGVDTAKMQNKTATRGQNIGLAGGIIGAVGGLAGLFSDKNLKTDIKADKMTDGLSKIRAYSYKYKGGTKPEAGVMAQDLEKTAMAPAVENTPIGKKIDTNRLTTMNTGALSEHEKRLQNIEKMVGNLKSYKKPGAK